MGFSRLMTVQEAQRSGFTRTEIQVKPMAVPQSPMRMTRQLIELSLSTMVRKRNQYFILG